MTLRLLLAALLTLALLVPGGVRPAAAAAAPEPPAWSELHALAGAPAEANPADPAWPAGGESSAATEALSEPASALPGSTRLPTAERGMEAPVRPPAPWPAEAPGSGIERPPRA
ncbi:MAG: hypothetical protein U1E77_12550 [Inhella sp.]